MRAGSHFAALGRNAAVLTSLESAASKFGLTVASQRFVSSQSFGSSRYSSTTTSRRKDSQKWGIWAAGALTLGSAVVYGRDPALCKWFAKDSKNATEKSIVTAEVEERAPKQTENEIKSTEIKSIEPTKVESVTKPTYKDVDPDSHPLWRSEQSRPFEKKYEETAIYSGSSNKVLAENIADCLGRKLG